MTVVGTRPELIRLSETIKKADQFFDHIFVHTGQNYDDRLSAIFYQDLDLRHPDYYLDVAGKHLGVTLGNIISRSYALMREVCPDALLILGDTNSALAAISAKRLKIPIFHMEAGNRCFDENLPEETNRRIVDHISDVNLTYTEHARRYLIAEGVRKEHIYVTGSPMKEVILANEDKITHSQALASLAVKPQSYILLSAHREENIDDNIHFESLMKAVNKMAEAYQIPVIYSVHPRSERFLQERGTKLHPLVKKLPPFSFSDYSCLMRNAFCVVSDSGTMPEEAALEGFPAVCIRTSTERPEALDKGCFIIGNIQTDTLLQSVDMAVRLFGQKEPGAVVPDYEDANVSGKVVRIIQSYTEIINQKIWNKTV